MRFNVEQRNGKYVVRDATNGKCVGFSYTSPPMYAGESKTVAEWNNFYSALGFSQKLERIQGA